MKPQVVTALYQRHSAILGHFLLGHQPLEAEIDLRQRPNPPLETEVGTPRSKTGPCDCANALWRRLLFTYSMQKRHEKSRLRATFRRKLRYKRLFTQSKQAAGNQCCFCALTSASAAALVAMARSLARASAGQLGLGGLDVGLGLLEVGGGTHHFELGVGLLLVLRLPQLGDLFQRLVLGLRHESDHTKEADQVGAGNTRKVPIPPMELISIGVNWPMAQLVAYRNTVHIPVARPRR